MNIEEIFENFDVAENMRVADLGCGSASLFLAPFSRIVGKTGRVYAVDVVKSVLERIHSHAELEGMENIVTVWSDIETVGATKIQEKTLDRAVIINVLFQVEEVATIFREAARLLRKGGKLLVVDWQDKDSPIGPSRVERLEKRELVSAARQVGLIFERDFEAGPYHFGLIFIKS